MAPTGISSGQAKEKNMRAILISILIVSQAAFGVTANKVWRVPSGGTLPSWGPVNLASSNAVTGQIARSNLPTVGVVIATTETSVSNTYTSSTYTDIANATLSITTTGRPVFIGAMAPTTEVNGFRADGAASGGGFETSCYVKLLRDSTDVAFLNLNHWVTATSMGLLRHYWPASGINSIDQPAAGTYTYKLQAKCLAGSMRAVALKLYAYEF